MPGSSASAARYEHAVALLHAKVEQLNNGVNSGTGRDYARDVDRNVAEYLVAVTASLRRAERRGRHALVGSLGSGAFADRLRRSTIRFDDRAHDNELRALALLNRQWKTSLAFLALAVAGLLVCSLFMLHYSGRAVNGILELGRKADRYRRGDPLGDASSRHDEIGALDRAVHEFAAELQQRERLLKRYNLLAEVTHDIILFIDRADLVIIDANAAAEVAYGYSDLIGKPTWMLHAAEDPIDSDMMALSDRAEGLSYEGLHQRADGSVFPVEVHARTAEIEGRLTIVKTIRDISERRHAAERVAQALDHAIEASRLKSEFVATMSHEIRTPMHGVIGMSELLLETRLMPLQHEYALTVKESAQALLAIIDDILDFSKLEANKIELESVAFDPAQLVSSAINLARAAAGDKGITLRSTASPHVPAAVRGDPTRVRQVLINLIGNAVKFTARGEITVSTSIDRDEGTAIVLSFAVRDTGIGVRPEAREHLFEAFVQGDGSTTRRFGGTGLGLSISRRLVELMGGRIWLEEHDGPGATFCFTARFERTSEVVAPTAPPSSTLRHAGDHYASKASPGERYGRARILLAEDNALVRRVAEFQLEELEYAVDIVENGQQAIEAVENGDYELILMDMRMPEMDGLGATRAIRETERTTGRHIIVIALTANVLDGDREICIEAGMDDFLAKPLKLDTLRAALEHWLP
jgi:PAS domain S-box-containing protein